ncbi:hypothetical protein [Streptomyces antibioticus]|uniref:hypothetical protein n=1 Tax=Streptomyces antibioticus TaxID=1890 RepID=UPI0036D90C3E
MTRSGSNARKQAARRIAEAEGIAYTEALRHLVVTEKTRPSVSPEHADRPCPPDCPTQPAVNDDVPPWEQPSCPTHQPDAHGGWYLGDSYPLTRIEFLTKGGANAPVCSLELDENSVTSVPELEAFRSRLSAAAQREFDRDWDLLYDSEECGPELILTLQQADEEALAARALAQERQAIRHEFRAALGVDDMGYEELSDERAPVRTNHAEEIEHLAEVIDTATALLAMLLNHTNTTTKDMEQGPFAALISQGHPATADEVFSAADWELRSPS